MTTLHPITRNAIRLALAARLVSRAEVAHILGRANGDVCVLAVLVDVAALTRHASRRALAEMNEAFHSLMARDEE